jgi:RNA polymerase sigma-70 factor (ECF subfamily)
MPRGDPFADLDRLVRQVYAYVAYRVGDGPEAEDITSETFERALRYRHTFQSSRGNAIGWLIGIARRCIFDARDADTALIRDVPDTSAAVDIEADAVRHLDLTAALSQLDERSRELVALRYGADLSARQIADLLGMRTNTVEVALHRTLARLRELLAPVRETSELPLQLEREPRRQPG